MSGPTPHLFHYLTRRLRLRQYLQDPGEGRRQPQIRAQLLLYALLVGQVLRYSSFHALEAPVRSPARRNPSLPASFSDDALGYFTERLDPGPTRQVLLSKTFENCSWIGLAIDGTGAAWRAHSGCSLAARGRMPKNGFRRATLL